MSSLVCNGLRSNCDLPVNAITFPALHNAMSSEADGFAGPNHLFGLEDALDAGYRALNLDSCDCGGELKLCHGSCVFEGTNFAIGDRKPGEVFRNIKAFVDGNPSEVIIIELQANNNTLPGTYALLKGIDGFVDMMYAHPSPEDEWPTLRELVESNKRLILFQHGNIPPCSHELGNCPPGVHLTWDHMFETPWSLRTADQLLDPELSCRVRSGGGGSRAFYISNHYAGDEAYGLPSQDIAKVVNARGALESRHAACAQRLPKKQPNVLFVDFWSVGDVLAYAEAQNRALGPVENVTAAPTVAPAAAPTSSPAARPASEPPTARPTSSPSGRPAEPQSANPGSRGPGQPAPCPWLLLLSVWILWPRDQIPL